VNLAGPWRRVVIAFGLVTFGTCTDICRADCGNRVYAYDDKVVVFACGKTGPELRIILLDDASTLKIAGRVAVASSREFDTAGHYKNFLMLVRWDKFEVYDLADASHPALAAKFDLRKQENLTGYERIEQTAENRFLILTSMGVVDVTAEGEPATWTLKEVPATEELKNKLGQRPPEQRLQDENEQVIELRTNEKFRYELKWGEKSKPSGILHRQYLRKIDVGTHKDASILMLGARLETID